MLSWVSVLHHFRCRTQCWSHCVHSTVDYGPYLFASFDESGRAALSTVDVYNGLRLLICAETVSEQRSLEVSIRSYTMKLLLL